MSNYPPETHNGIVTSWIPLTSAYPSSSGCDTLWWSVVVSTLAVWDPGYGLTVDSNVHCVPPPVTSWWDQANLGANSLTQLSIGPITCPVDYTTVATSIVDETSTFVACCPPNYTLVSIVGAGDTSECSSILPANENIAYAVRDESQNWITATTSYTTATPIWGIQINGYNIAQASSTSSTGPSSTPSETGTPTPTPTPQPSSGLSTGAKAGIGVGVALVAIALGALVVWILARRRKRGHAVAAPPPSELAYEQRKSGYGGGYTDQVPVHELGSGQTGLSEMDGTGMPVEMHAVNVNPKR
ncbi:hypothetical protein L207DRAFT_572109 [Hyaloscypha variabilis F]|uniref:Mid2 domain-containing protein n=1 Tax=Hyaloscypha variabilis (strain UAMH 11265 / GT02V1 / F) TaxID=1149755 RepID=A0A2J6R1B0_HYAVF|nr:hypothetical protein L207DRAFT_572109 [Hyaloscypha variabilis F]